MSFSVFPADPFQPRPDVQCYSVPGFRGRRCPRTANSRASPPPSSRPTAAAFIPVMLMGGPGHPGHHTGYTGHHIGHPRHHTGHPCHHTGHPRQHPGHQSDPHQHGHPTTGPQPPHQLPPCMSDYLSQYVVSDAFSLAEAHGMLEELLGQFYEYVAEKGGQSAGKQPSSAQTPSREEKKADSESSPKATQQQRGEEPSEGGKAESCPPLDTASAQSLWHHSYFPRNSPNKVSAKVKDGKVHVHLVHEKTGGPGASYCKTEVIRVVVLPENVDQKTLTCTMKLDGALVLQAQLKENPAVEAKENAAETTDALEDEWEKVSFSESTPGDVQDSADTQEQVTTEADSGVAVEKKADDEEERHADRESREPTEKDAAFCKDELEEDQTAEQQLCSRPGDEAQGGDCEELEYELLSLQADVEDNVIKPATAEENPITFAIIQEPEDESSSSDEETPRNHKLSHQSSTEDFVVIEKGSVKTGNVSYGDNDAVSEWKVQARKELALFEKTGDRDGVTEWNVRTGEVLASVDHHAQTEGDAAGEEQTDSTPDDTDPTRPINRSSGGPQTPQESELNSTMPGEQRGTLVDGRGTGATHPHHAAFHVSLPLVGFSPQNVRVHVEGGTLHLSATRQAWAGGAPYTESVQRQLQIPAHLDVLTVRCVYKQDDGCLLISAEPQGQQRQVPVQAGRRLSPHQH